jgi:hypothetical protein
MTGADKIVCQAAALLVLFALTLTPAKAQFGGGGGGQDMMTQMAPMLEMMKAKMGKKRFGALMQTMGPMMSRMTENGGGDLGGLGGLTGGGELMSMVPQLMSIANVGGGRHGRRHRKR